MPWGRALLLGLAWQALPAGWLLVDSWDSATTTTLVLRAVVFAGVPLLASGVHRSWRVGLACLVAPVLGMGMMMTVFMLMMPTGKW